MKILNETLTPETNSRVSFWGVFIALMLVIGMNALIHQQAKMANDKAQVAKSLSVERTTDRFTGSDAAEVLGEKDRHAALRDERAGLIIKVVCTRSHPEVDKAVYDELCTRNWVSEMREIEDDFCSRHPTQPICRQQIKHP